MIPCAVIFSVRFATAPIESTVNTGKPHRCFTPNVNAVKTNTYHKFLLWMLSLGIDTDIDLNTPILKITAHNKDGVNPHCGCPLAVID